MGHQISTFRGGEWFELYLTTGEAGVGTFCGLLRRNGHDPYRGRNGQGEEFVAVRVRAGQPARELERLIRSARLAGYFRPLPMSAFRPYPAPEIELAPIR
jgi:hypothetical protein